MRQFTRPPQCRRGCPTTSPWMLKHTPIHLIWLLQTISSSLKWRSSLLATGWSRRRPGRPGMGSCNSSVKTNSPPPFGSIKSITKSGFGSQKLYWEILENPFCSSYKCFHLILTVAFDFEYTSYFLHGSFLASSLIPSRPFSTISSRHFSRIRYHPFSAILSHFCLSFCVTCRLKDVSNFLCDSVS